MARSGIAARAASSDEPELLWYPAKRCCIRVAGAGGPHEATRRVDHLRQCRDRRESSAGTTTSPRAAARRVFDPNPYGPRRLVRPLLTRGTGCRAARRGICGRAPPRSAANGRLDGQRVTTPRSRAAPAARRLDFRCTVHPRGLRGSDGLLPHGPRDRAISRRSATRAGARSSASPCRVNARGTREDNSWYSPGERRSPSALGDVDDAEDGETILHEFGHAIQDAICPDFGQSPEAAAMGEGFGDYFAGSFFAAQEDGRQRYRRRGDDAGTASQCERQTRRACGASTASSPSRASITRRTPTSTTTARSGRPLCGTSGTRVGRDVADRIIIESHFQLDGFTTFARGARAILDADRNLYRGGHARPEAHLPPARDRAGGVDGRLTTCIPRARPRGTSAASP